VKNLSTLHTLEKNFEGQWWFIYLLVGGWLNNPFQKFNINQIGSLNPEDSEKNIKDLFFSNTTLDLN